MNVCVFIEKDTAHQEQAASVPARMTDSCVFIES